MQRYLVSSLVQTFTTALLGVILRDEVARQKFKKEIGHIGITLQVRPLSHCFVCLIFFRTLFNSKGLEYEDVSQSLIQTLGASDSLNLQVILYNFFEESADVNLWRHLVNDDRDHHKVWELKYAPLIHEVSDRVSLQVSDV
jgi:hypothetical protein